jgi:transcription antitermination protein NusB
VLERRKARRAALELLYQSDILGIPVTRILAEDMFLHQEPLPEFGAQLAVGVEARMDETDRLISLYADNWTLDRMPVVDRNILRLATYELLAEPDIPASVSINEAVELAKTYGTEDSGKFVNGLLGRIAEEIGAVARGKDGDEE